MAAPNYPTQEVLFGAGEGVDIADLNGMQRMLRSQIWDQVVSSRIHTTEIEDYVAVTLAYCAPAGSGAPVASATVRTVTNTFGLLLKKYNGLLVAGADAGLMSHIVEAGAMSTQLAVGDATNPRIDRILYKLEYIDNDAADNEARIVRATSVPYTISSGTPVKRRKVQMTMATLQGTPAATPTAPSITALVTAGYALWCEVYVPATHNAVIDVENIRDYRVPVGYDQHTVICSGLGQHVFYGAAWAPLTTGPGIQSTGSATAYVIPQARSRHAGRLLRLAIMGMLSGSTVQIVRLNHDNTAGFGGETVLQDISASFNGGANQLYESTAFTNPIWLNGFTAGVAAATNPKAAPNDARMSTLAIKIIAPSAGKLIKFVDFGVGAG